MSREAAVAHAVWDHIGSRDWRVRRVPGFAGNQVFLVESDALGVVIKMADPGGLSAEAQVAGSCPVTWWEFECEARCADDQVIPPGVDHRIPPPGPGAVLVDHPLSPLTASGIVAVTAGALVGDGVHRGGEFDAVFSGGPRRCRRSLRAKEPKPSPEGVKPARAAVALRATRARCE